MKRYLMLEPEAANKNLYQLIWQHHYLGSHKSESASRNYNNDQKACKQQSTLTMIRPFDKPPEWQNIVPDHQRLDHQYERV